MPTHIVDTHALIWFLGNDRRLGDNALNVLRDPRSVLILPAVALAECLWIASSRKLGVAPEEVVLALDSDSRITVYPLTREIVEAAHRLKSIGEMHDRQIAATSLHLSEASGPCILLSRDADIVNSGVVSTLW